MIDTNTVGDIVTVQKFAEMFRVDASQVRRWAKEGRIDYVLDGPRKLKRIRVSAVVTVIKPNQMKWHHKAIIEHLIAQGMAPETAVAVATSMSDESIGEFLKEARDGKQKLEKQDHPQGPAGAAAGTNDDSGNGGPSGKPRRDAKPARPAKAKAKG